jgi:predicted porin
MAKQLDPKDPTPYFYDAIAKQTTNRPVEALQELEKARELNDNRAVYRSQLLLDSDDAARAASQARVYTDLGFEQRALVEGWSAVNTDPTNFSAHRFLADTYAVLPRHEIARVSELLQSQLLAPVSNTPLQPRLAESNLLLISSGGPGTASFNEFNPLFNRSGPTLLLSGLVGEHDTFGGDIVVGGIAGNLGYSFGYSRFETDGFRANSDQEDWVANAFVQYDFSPQTSIQAEYRHREIKYGDLQQRFFAENYSSSLRQTDEVDTFRVGGRHAFSANSILLASVSYQDRQSDADLNEFPVAASTRFPQSAWGAELSHLYRSQTFNLRSGIGYFDISGDLSANVTLDLPPPPDGPGLIESQTVSKSDARHWNLYAYADIKLMTNLTTTLGLSYDSVKGDLLGFPEKSQVNPKVGITWNPLPATTVRAAAFRALKRTLITDQTLEPTEVAGFNQFYDDASLTESWRYGAAIDQKFANNLFGGLEVSWRDLTVPFIDVRTEPAQASDGDWEEGFGRAYLFWAPHPWWALRAEYVYEKFERDEQFAPGVKELETHRVPLGFRFFHPSGFSASLTATYWNQKGEFDSGGVGDTPFISGKDSFWLVDAGIGYRLPKRYGTITVGVTNLFDTDFNYYAIDTRNATILPTRTVFARLSLAFP